MSSKELRRVEVLGRAGGTLRLLLCDATVLMHSGYRQTKRLWRRYKVKGAESL